MKKGYQKFAYGSIRLKMFLSFVSVIISISSCTAKCPNRNGVDDDTYLITAKPKKVMPPKSVLKKIAKSKLVKAYAINALSEDTISEKVCGFSTIGEPKTLTALQIGQLKSVIANDSNYFRKDNVVKYSTFLPDYAFKFMNGKDSVVVFMDFHADLWSFRYKKKDYILDNDVTSQKLRVFVGSVFNIKLKDPKMENVSQNAISDGTFQRNEVEETPKKDTMKYEKIPSNVEKVIRNVDSVYCYILDPLADNNVEKRLGKFVILQERLIDGKTTSLLTHKLLKKNSFPTIPYVQNCTFLPDIAFVLYHKTEKLNVMFSFYCNECQMVLNDKLVFQNECGNIQSDIIALAKRVYPKDKYLRTISKK